MSAAGGAIATSAFEAAGRGIGGAVQQVGVTKGSRAAEKVINEALQESESKISKERKDQINIQQPYMQAGAKAVDDLESFRMREDTPYQTQNFQGVDMEQDPGYQFRMQEGVDALDASAANRGSLFSGAQQKALANYGQDLASQEYNNAFNRQYGQFKDESEIARDQSNIESQRMMDIDKSRMTQLQDLSGRGQEGATSYGDASLNLSAQELENYMMLKGQGADQKALQASGPFMGAGSVIGSAGQSGGDISQYYMASKK